MSRENALAATIVQAAIHVHTQLGPGLLETVYEIAMYHELTKLGLQVDRQVPIPIQYKGYSFDQGFKADLLVEKIVLVELKSVEKTAPVHHKQTLTYIKLANKKLGLLINFGEVFLRNGIKRIVNGLPDY